MSFTMESELGKNHTKALASNFSYKPVDPLEIEDKDSKYAYRWVNLNKLEKNNWRHPSGWEVEHTLTKTSGQSQKGNGFLDKASPLDGTVRVGDLIRCIMPKEKAEARKEYYKNKNSVRRELIHAKDSVKGYGSGTFEKSRGAQSMKESF